MVSLFIFVIPNFFLPYNPIDIGLVFIFDNKKGGTVRSPTSFPLHNIKYI